jgi:anthranilate synthase component 2
LNLLIIDNFDSFTYNLQHYAEQFCDSVTVKRNDEFSIEEIDDFDAFIISPGPGLPKDAGITMEAIRTYAKSKKILGVCLGHQAIAEAFGAKLRNLDKPLHGVAIKTQTTDIEDAIFTDIPNNFYTARYHSWVVDKESISRTGLNIIATDTFGQVQSLKHKSYNLRSVQFHPESVLTEYGLKMVENWIKKC